MDRPSPRLIVVLGLLSMFGPISLDLYLPALPNLADDLRTSASAAQLSITACLVGLAVGQLVAGPLSDRFGRRRPLVVGLAAYLLASAACAFAPTIELLLVLRLVQGLAGAAGVVIARAVARDLFTGRALVVFFARLMLVSGMAPIVAPLLGGQLAKVMDWRGMFGVLAAFGLVLLLAGVLGVSETLPPERRVAGGVLDALRGFGSLLRDRRFAGVTATTGLASASMFAYIAGATFVLQRVYGMSAQGFSFVFGANSIGIVAMGQLGARLVRRSSPLRLLAVGVGLNLIGSTGVVLTVLTGLGRPFLIGSLWVMVSALGLVFPNATAIALSEHGDRAGSASAVLGLAQYIVGALAAPLVGLAGDRSAVPLGIVVICASVAATTVFATTVLPSAMRQRVSVR